MIHQELEDFGKLFANLSTPPIIVNTMDTYSEEAKENIKRLIFTKYDSDVMSVVPRCDCGELTGHDNVGRVCGECQRVCGSQLESDITPILWMAPPQGVKALINPIIWIMASRIFRIDGVNVIRWMCDSSYQSPRKFPPILAQLEDMGITRGYNNFIDNFDKYMDMLIGMRRFRRNQNVKDFEWLIKNYRDRVLCKYIPLPNRSLMVVEERNDKRILDTTMIGLVDATLMMAGIDTPVNAGLSVRVRENRTAKVLNGLTEGFYNQYFYTNLNGKTGHVRKHMEASRLFYSFRAVISSITKVHNFEEIHIPWTIGVGALNTHLLNKLEKRGIRGIEAKNFLTAHALEYHPLIDEMFREIIADSEEGGIPCMFCRYPSLMRASIQKFVITKVKTDVGDPTIGLSILDVVGFNADKIS